MTPILDTRRTIIQINFKLVHACALIGVGYIIWPNDPRWYAFYALSVLMWLGAVICISQAFSLGFTVRRNERLNREILARGQKPHSAKLIKDNEDLQKAGLID